MIQQQETKRQAVELVALWAAVGIGSWADAAAMAACIYSLLLICRFIWRHLLRDFAVRVGLVEPLRGRRHDDSEL